MDKDNSSAIPTLLFGAFDRHNFGDMLFPHVVTALLPGRKMIHAGLAERDLQGCGGFQVKPLAWLVDELKDQPVNIIHVGGELLTCDAWQAAIMLLTPEQARTAIQHYENRPSDRIAYARDIIGISALAPYTVSRSLFPLAQRVVYNGVGGVDLGERDPDFREEVYQNIKTADVVSVRDRVTLAYLESEGINARLIPDPAVMVVELFEDIIGSHARQGEVAQVLNCFPQGYIAVQYNAEFGDDETLGMIAGQLDAAMAALGVGVVLFRAGAAPWHDDLDCYRRAAIRMRLPAVKIFESINIWDICALIANSRGFCGSSLHGRIVAMACALPRVNIRLTGQRHLAAKQMAYAATWELAEMPAVVDVTEIADGLDQAFSVDNELLKACAKRLCDAYRHEINIVTAGM